MIVILKILAAFAATIGCIGAFYYFLKRFHKHSSKLSIVDVLAIDSKRKIVTVHSDKKAYMILLGEQELLLDSYSVSSKTIKDVDQSFKP